MKRVVRIIAILIAVGAITCWAALGANRGWTRTTVPIMTVDEVTGIEGITYQSKFVPGLEVLGGALLGAALLAGASFLVRKQTQVQTQTKQ